MRTNGHPSGQLSPKRWPLSNTNRTKSIMNKHNVKHLRNSDTETLTPKQATETTSDPPSWNGQ